MNHEKADMENKPASEAGGVPAPAAEDNPLLRRFQVAMGREEIAREIDLLAVEYSQKDEDARLPPGQSAGRRGEKSAQAGPARRGHPAGGQQTGLRPHRAGQAGHRRRTLRGKDGRPRRGGTSRPTSPSRSCPRSSCPSWKACASRSRPPRSRARPSTRPSRSSTMLEGNKRSLPVQGPAHRRRRPGAAAWCSPPRRPARGNGRARRPIS